MKIYVCDTSSLVHSPTALQSLGEGHIIIPMAAYEELDALNHGRNDQASYNARQVIKLIDKLQEEQTSEVIKLESGGILYLEDDCEPCLSESYNLEKADNRILNTAVSIMYRTHDDVEVILVTNDAALRSKARKHRLQTMPLAEDRVNLRQSEMYQGWQELYVSPERIDSFYAEKFLKVEKELQPNEFVLLKDEFGSTKSALAKYNAKAGVLVPLKYTSSKPWGIQPRNVQQTFLMEALLDPEIQIVSIPAPAGTGKSLVTIACAGHQVEESKYQRLTVFKPLQVIGPDLGYLPGDIDDKLGPHMDSIRDALDFIFGPPKTMKKDGEIIAVPQWQYLIDKEMLELKSVTHLRGRSLPSLFMFVDEAQNLTPTEIRTIVTRCGEGTKIVFAGDPQQIDNKYLDSQTNGLTYLTERFKGQQCFATVKLVKTERSTLAELGAQLL